MLAAALTLLPAVAQAQAIQAWVQHSDIPSRFWLPPIALALDASGNLVVSASSYGGDGSSEDEDWLTTKYSSTGVPLCTNRYNGPGNFLDKPTAIAADASGNLVVAGSTCVGADYSDMDYATIKYSSAGQPLWTNRYDGPAHDQDYASAIAVDASGNIYVTGVSAGADYPDSSDYATIKYSSAGVPLWTNRYNGPAHGSDYPQAIAVDASGNVVVTGYSPGSGILQDNFLTIKYSSAGAPLWTRRYNAPGDQWARARTLAVDAGGNVIVAGCSSDARLTTIKYSTAGVPLWTNYSYGFYDGGNAVAVDANDDVYVTGESAELASPGYYYAFATVKYSSAGALLWTNRYPGLRIKAGHNTPRALALDASGNVAVTGGSCGIGGLDMWFWDIATVAYSRSGVPLWTNRYNGPGNRTDYAWQVAVDASNSVYVAACSETSDSTIGAPRFVSTTVKYVVPPIITRQPHSCTNAAGTTASFSVEVAGGLPLSYQWRREGTNLVDGGNLSGVTTTNLLIGNVQLSDALGYSVVVTNAYGSATSHVAQLTVTIPPSPGRFSNFSYSPTTGFSFVFRDATIDRPYRIQRAASPTEGGWSDWMNFTFTEPIVLTDLGAVTATNRFYRAVGPEP